MLLRRLNDLLPALCRGFESPETGFEPYAAQIARELEEWLRIHPVQVELSGLCPLDFLLLFRPDRRTAVFSGKADISDWRWAAAVRLTELLANLRPGIKADVFDALLRDWKSSILLRQGSGLPEFVRNVFCGMPADERLLTAPAVIHGAKLKCFIAKGSTSQVYLADFHGRNSIVKIPVSGGESRFRNELEWLRHMAHPNLPEVFACDAGDSPYCIMEWCHIGKGIKRGKTSGFFHALDYLHRRFVLHGDIRWSNLGLRDDGSPVLLDFSHAKRIGSRFFAGEADAETQKLKCLLT